MIVNDYGVSVDGNEPTSEVADQVVAEIEAAGGKAAANAQSVTTMEGGASIVNQAVETFGHIDGVVCVAGILRERMLFNMSEAEWDPVIETHLKGTFTVFRAAAPIFREQKSGTMLAFTSGAFAASVAQANYSAAKGGIVSLCPQRGGRHEQVRRDGQRIAPVAKSRMSGQVPFGLEMGEPEDVAPMVAFLCSDHARNVTGQIYTVNGGRVAVWNQPAEVREMRKDGRWSVDELAARFNEVGQEPMPILAALAEREAAAKPARSRTSNRMQSAQRIGSWRGEPSITRRRRARRDVLAGCGMLGFVTTPGEEFVAWPRSLAFRAGALTAVPSCTRGATGSRRGRVRAGRKRVDLRGLDLPTDPNGPDARRTCGARRSTSC